jgi:hypothetical protein
LHWKVTPAWFAAKVNVARGLVDFTGGVEVIVVTGGARDAGGVAVAVPASGARGCASEPAGDRVTPVEGPPDAFSD